MFHLKLIFPMGLKMYDIDCKKQYTGTTHAIKRGKAVLKSFKDVEKATLKVLKQATDEVVKELSFNKGVWRVIK